MSGLPLVIVSVKQQLDPTGPRATVRGLAVRPDLRSAEHKRERARIVAVLDKPACSGLTSIRSGAADDGKRLFGRRRVHELDRDRSVRKNEGDVADRDALDVRNGAEPAARSDLLAVPEQDIVEDEAVAQAECAILLREDCKLRV